MNNFSRRRLLASAGALTAGAGLGSLTGQSALAADDSLAFLPAVDLAQKLKSKEMSALELTQFFINRIEKYDGVLNAVVVRDFDRAIEAAKHADSVLLKKGALGPLHGLPMTIKESYDIAGLPTTWGVPEAVGNIAQADAAVVTKFKQAGALFLGKTNVPINLGDFQSYNAIYGTTNNPWDVKRTPGGSSGGSAVALAAGMTGLESGSDIGGSIRNPAHFCGVYGHKPTLSVVPSRGHQPPGIPAGGQHPDLAVVGPMSRSAEDLAVALDIVAGADFLTSPGWHLQLPQPRMRSLKGLRVALWPDESIAPVSSEVADRVQSVGEVLRKAGAKVSDTARPAFTAKMAHDTYMGILTAMTSGPTSELKFSEYQALDGRRGGLRALWQQFFKEWDVLICPTTATPAFPQDQSELNQRTLMVNNEQRSYFEQLFWAGLATLSYLPSTVFPTGPSAEGLPIGLQAIGAEYDDRTTIEFARLMAQEIGGYQPPPGYA